MATWFPTPKGLTLVEIQQRFSTAEKAREYLEAVQWPNGPVCPFCGEQTRIGVLNSATVRPGLKKCYACRKQFTVTVGTVFEDSHIKLNKWLIAVYLMCASKKGMSAHQLHRMLGITYKTAWFMFHRLRFAVTQTKFGGKLGGPGKVVETDDTWIGGKNRGQGKGKGWQNKSHVFSILERGGNVRSMKMGSVTASNLKTALREHVDTNTRLMTDSASVFHWPSKEFASHEKVDHSAGEYVRGDVTTNGVEGYFALLKRGVHGTYHHISKQHLGQYLGEFDFRFNNRKMDDGPRTDIAIARTRGKRLMLRAPLASRKASR
jgi:transposase-like protein